MKKLPSQEEQIINATAQRIWEDIIYSMDQYTNDSMQSKFYLPESIQAHCSQASVIFTQLLYNPIPRPEKIKRTRLFTMMQLAMTCGVQIYLKERMLNKGFSPYKISNDEKIIREARREIGKSLSKGIKVKPPVSQVMELFITELNTPRYLRKFYIKGHKFNSDKFDNLLPAAIMWGYLLIQRLLID